MYTNRKPTLSKDPRMVKESVPVPFGLTFVVATVVVAVLLAL